MRAAAYCRVSTNKDEQLDSLEAQQIFFTEYSKKNGFELVGIYADEGKSGTKMKNRTQLLKMLSDADKGLFDIVLIKDISRLARNTVDFLTSVRKLKTLGVKVVFVNYDQTSSDSSEFMLTMLSAIAQEESANTSKRVKFGKKMNAEKGRVPNLVYGYDKINGEYFTLNINEREAAVVRRIFDLYTNKNIGTNKIALILNNEGCRTKKGCKWSQNAITRLLTNKIYTGMVINGKEEVADFLTGKRKARDSDAWFITEKPELKLISNELYMQTQMKLTKHSQAFKITGERTSQKHTFSKLIRCKYCGSSFRQTVRKYKNTYVKWVCTGRNVNGAAYCPNKTVLDETELLTSLKEYFIGDIFKDKPYIYQSILTEVNRLYKTKNAGMSSEKRLSAQLKKINKSRQKYMDMYEMEVISAEELREKTKELTAEAGRLTEELMLAKVGAGDNDVTNYIFNDISKDMDNVLKIEYLNNSVLSRIIENIIVDEHGTVVVYLKNNI